VIDGATRAGILRYVRGRRCREGGYCFYRLEEPNGSDTFHAVATLALLGALGEDVETVSFLKERQLPDGSYESVMQAYYCILSLDIFGQRPRLDPSAYLLSQFETYDPDLVPVEVPSVFRKLFLVAAAWRRLGLAPPPDKRGEILSFLLRFRKDDGGFGHPSSTLLETCQALAVFRLLGADFPGPGAEAFLRACEDPVYGFLNIPGVRPAFLEHVAAGVGAAGLLGLRPRYTRGLINFVSACRTTTGGFSRTTNTGIATLENTHEAVGILAALDGRGQQMTA